MKRLLLCLPICLLLAPESLPPLLPEVRPELQDVVDDGTALPSNEAMTSLATSDPIAFVEKSLLRYDREVHGYRLLFKKRERVQGTVHKQEIIDVAFREDPFSVRFFWKQGAREATRVLYVQGENDNKLIAKGANWRSVLGLLHLPVDCPDAKKSGRLLITEFGLKIGAQQTLSAWLNAAKNEHLHVEYLGERAIPELGGRVCWVLRRSQYECEEEDGVGQTTLYFDKETWHQTGAQLRTANGGFIADYWFCEVELNPEFEAGTFKPDALKK